MTGDLTLRSVTRPVEFTVPFGGAVTDAYGNARVAFQQSPATGPAETRTHI